MNEKVFDYEYDTQRILWLEEDIDRLEDVRGYVINTEGATVRDAIDHLSKLQAEDVAR